MVIKKRVGQQCDKFILPLVKDSQSTKPLLGRKRPLHHRHHASERLHAPFWRRNWGSKQFQEPILPSWANPQDDHVVPSPVHGYSKLVFTATKRKPSKWSFRMFIFVVVGLLTYWHLKVSLHRILTETKAMMEVRKQIRIKLHSAQQDVQMSSREITATEARIQRRRDQKAQLQAREAASVMAARDISQKALEKLQKRLSESNTIVSALYESVQRYSRNAVLSKYGGGRHLVEVELQFPDGDQGPSSFVMELAPLDKMPHSVHVFLDMVSNGLWDGCSFVMKAMHVIKAAPLPYDDNDESFGVETAKAFLKKGLDGPSFKEYNAEYPHKRYTVGFAGGSSPSFYINTDDNTEIHAGDSAFAKIVSGLEAIKRLESSPTQNRVWFRDRVGIKHIAML